MSVSKSLRFSILRRDGFTCRYCGAKASDDAELTIDHIIPAAHGGPDDGTNLVTACRDCNAGKAASPVDLPVANPDEALIKQMQEQIHALRERIEAEEELVNLRQQRSQIVAPMLGRFYEYWQEVFEGRAEEPALNYLEKWLPVLGLDTLLDNVWRAQRKVDRTYNGARYFYGMCWRQYEQATGHERPS